MLSLADFSDIILHDEPLAPYTWLKLGGPAQFLVQPRTIDELLEVVRACREAHIPLRLLGGGSNLLIRDEGVSGAVIRLAGEGFAEIETDGERVKAGAAALLS